ncbi:MAG: LamG-like jellyroll fold domain-containing protein, partial [Anaerolineae bacterium]
AYGGNNHLYRNEGNENHWLHLKLIGAAPDRTQTTVGSNMSAIGARVTVMATIDGRAVQQVQEVSGQTGMYNQNSLDVEFGLGDAIVVDVLTVRWPSGVFRTLTDVAADQFITLVYDDDQGAARIYFAAGDLLYQMNLDGSDLRIVASGLASNRNQSLFADPLGNTIYANGWDQQAQIKILDASTGVLTEFSDGPGDGGGGLAVDPVGDKLYEGLYYDGVYALDMNNGSWTQLVDSDELYPMHGQRGQLQIDPNRRQIYFRTSYNGNCGECRYIWRVGFDGDGLTQIVTANGGDAMALDLSERKMYFSDVPGEGTIKWAYMEPGSSKETLFTLPEPYRYCRAIRLDLENRKMYLNLYNEDTGYRDRALARMNMDGTGFEILHTLTGNDWLDIHGEMTLLLPAPPPPPLLVKYDFEGDFLASGTVLDRSGNGNDAQITGEVATSAGISGGQGISFNGNGYVQAASNPAAGKTDITFSLWFKTDQPGENYKLASAAWWNGGPGSGWIMATHVPEFWSDDGQGLVVPGQPNNENGFAAGAWNHEVITYDGSRIKEYTNGQLINDWPTTGAAIGAGLPMAVGAWPMFSGYNFQGSLDEFAIYDRSLTQQEVQALYEQGR